MAEIGFEEFIQDNVQELVDKADWMKDREMILVGNINELKDFVDKAIAAGTCVLDVETTGLSTRTKKGPNGQRIPVIDLVGIGLSYAESVGVYVPIAHKVGKEFNLPLKNVIDEIRRLCANCIICMHNAKYDLAVLGNLDVHITQYDRFEDTLILARLYDAGEKQINLKVLSEKLLGQKQIKLDQATGGNHRLDLVSPKIAVAYVCGDAMCTLQLFHYFMSQQVIKDQRSIYHLEKRLVRVVMEMEANLFKVDKGYLEKMVTAITARMEELTKEIIRLVGREFTISSPQQVGKILFVELGYRYPEKEKTKSGQFSTSDATLQKIASDYPVVGKILEYRGLDKNLNTYVKNLLANTDEDGCVKLGFNQTGTDTGRFSSPGGEGLEIDGYCGVNIQSLPSIDADGLAPLLKEMPIRRAFIARPGYKILAADYSGEELRVTANLSKEPKWIEEFLHGSGDIHTKTGQAIYGRQEITKPERKIAKVSNFLISYGGGPHRLSEQAKIPLSEASRIMQAYFAGLPQLKKWIDVERARARKQKFAKTSFGRIRPLNNFYDSGDKGLEAHGDRCAVNFIVQGGSADIMKTTMVRLYNWIHGNVLQDDVRMLITMHDEIVFEIRETRLMELVPKINQIMKLSDVLQGHFKWPVPLEVDAEYGDSWDVHNDFFKEHPELKSAEDISFHVEKPITLAPTPEVKETPTPEPTPAPENKDTPIPPVSEPTNQSDTPPPEKTEQAVEKTETSVEASSNDIFVYTVKDTTRGTLRRLNHLLMYLLDEQESSAKYEGPLKLIQIRDLKGNVFSVSNLRFRVDAFLGLARYLSI